MSRARLAVTLARPSLVTLMGLVAVLGVVSAGGATDVLAVLLALVTTAGFVVAAVAVNDVADEAVDRVNLPADLRRPLVAGTAHRRQVLAVGALGSLVALAGAAAAGPQALALVAGALILAVAYSLDPVRLSARGIVGPLVLPVGFVVVPFFAGAVAVRGHLVAADLALVGGLYLGFVGRLVLKDVRDVRGDTLLGKRTFLVRHGRAATFTLSGALCVVGSVVLLAVPDRTPALVVAYLAQLAAALVVLALLARSRNARRDETLVAAFALLGRGAVLSLVVHAVLRQHPAALPDAAVHGLVTGVVLLATAIALHGRPAVRLRVPADVRRPLGAARP